MGSLPAILGVVEVIVEVLHGSESECDCIDVHRRVRERGETGKLGLSRHLFKVLACGVAFALVPFLLEV